MDVATVDHALSLPSDEAASVLGGLPESQWFERKSGAVKPADLAVPLIAMANSEGGVVVVGLDDDGSLSPVSDQAANKLRQAVADFTRPPVKVLVEELVLEAGRILVFRVEIGETVHESQKGECFARHGDSSRKLTFQQRQELEWDRGHAQFEGKPLPEATFKELDESMLASFQEQLGTSTAQKALEARYLVTVKDELTIAGCLLFGRTPQRFFPNAHVRVLKYDEDARGSGRYQTLVDGADVRCEGPIPSQIEQASDVIEGLMPKRRVLGDSGKFEGLPRIPKSVWLEGVLNAVVHRSYSIGGDHIRVELFPNRVEICSPGRFPGIADISQPRTIRRQARNPRIARVCSDLGLTQELGEGIRRMCDDMQKAGLTDPLYSQTAESVVLTLLASDAVPSELRDQLGEKCMHVLAVMRRARRPLSTGQVVEACGYARPTTLRYLRALQSAGLVDWNGDSANDPRASWVIA